MALVERAPYGYVEETQTHCAEELPCTCLGCVQRRVVKDILHIVEYAVEGLEQRRLAG